MKWVQSPATASASCFLLVQTLGCPNWASYRKIKGPKSKTQLCWAPKAAQARRSRGMEGTCGAVAGEAYLLHWNVGCQPVPQHIHAHTCTCEPGAASKHCAHSLGSMFISGRSAACTSNGEREAPIGLHCVTLPSRFGSFPKADSKQSTPGSSPSLLHPSISFSLPTPSLILKIRKQLSPRRNLM